ncbi:MAG: hypothetical protein U0002_18555 [Thermoanaerobaculia bacterium]
MSHLDRILDLLPAPYSVAPDSVIGQLLGTLALELDAFDEDLGRLQRSHWIGTAERLEDAARLGELLDIPPLPWETLGTYRARLLPLVAARLAGSLSPQEIERFVFDYLSRSERPDTLDSLFLPPGLGRLSLDQAFGRRPAGAHFRPLALVENPERPVSSPALAARNGLVPYLFRWQEENRGLDEAVAELSLVGLSGGRTAVPVLLNRTTGELLGYRGVLSVGQTLTLRRAEAAGGDRPRLATAELDGRDVTARLFGGSGFALAAGWQPEKLEAGPQLPRLVRGRNDWIYLSLGLFDTRGLDHVFFALADDELYEGVFDQSRFDHALFPSGPAARLALSWVETTPAAFEVRVPRYLVAEPSELAAAGEAPPWQRVAEGLESSLAALHAAGVSSALSFVPFVETQPQQVRVALPWVRLEPEAGPAGRDEALSLGGRFGESTFGGTRFE